MREKQRWKVVEASTIASSQLSLCDTLDICSESNEPNLYNYFIGAMQSIEQLNNQSTTQFVNYQRCPWWALPHFQGRPISVVGRVVLVQQSSITLELDPTQNKKIKVEIVPFKFKYCFSDEQFGRLKASENYNEFRPLLQPSNSLQAEGNQGNGSNKGGENESGSKMATKEAQPQKLISANSFRVGSVVQIRGTSTEASVLKMQEFTKMDDNLDLDKYNQMLRVIIERMEHLYY